MTESFTGTETACWRIREPLPWKEPSSRGESMDRDTAQEISERDQLWASLRALRAEIDRIAAGSFDGSHRQREVVQLVARIVTAEMSFRERQGPSGG